MKNVYLVERATAGNRTYDFHSFGIYLNLDLAIEAINSDWREEKTQLDAQWLNGNDGVLLSKEEFYQIWEWSFETQQFIEIIDWD